MDELDLLIDDALSDADPAPEDETPGDVAAPSEAGDEAAVAPEDEESPEDEAEELLDDEDEDEPLEVIPQPAQPSSTDQQNAFLRQQLAEREVRIAQHEQRQQVIAAENQIAALRAQWSEMDPDEAHRAELDFVSNVMQGQNQHLRNELQRLYQAQQQAVYDAQEAADKPRAIELAITKWKLRPEDAEILNTVTDAAQLDPLAQSLKAQRQAQTAAARARKAERLAGNPALTGGTVGKSIQATPPDPANLDELLDQLFPETVS